MQRNRQPQTALFAFVFWTMLLCANASGITGQSVFFFDYEQDPTAGVLKRGAGNFHRPVVTSDLAPQI